MAPGVQLMPTGDAPETTSKKTKKKKQAPSIQRFDPPRAACAWKNAMRWLKTFIPQEAGPIYLEHDGARQDARAWLATAPDELTTTDQLDAVYFCQEGSKAEALIKWIREKTERRRQELEATAADGRIINVCKMIDGLREEMESWAHHGREMTAHLDLAAKV